MSWDIAIVKIHGSFRSIQEVEENDYLALGKLKTVKNAIDLSFAQVTWSGPTHAIYADSDIQIEFDCEELDSSNSIVLHVSGSGDPISPILKFTESNGWLAVDCSTGEFIDPENPSYEGWDGYQSLLIDSQQDQPDKS